MVDVENDVCVYSFICRLALVQVRYGQCRQINDERAEYTIYWICCMWNGIGT